MPQDSSNGHDDSEGQLSYSLDVSDGPEPERGAASDRDETQLTQVARPRPLRRREASILSPLRYAGSKRRLAGYIERALKLNELHPSLFIEGFGGGISVSLQLLNDGIVEKIGVIDRDPLVAAFWQTVFWDADWLVGEIQQVKVTLEQWYEYKAQIPTTRRERALACLFLNRTSFSGILAPGAGPIGGRKQSSDYKLDCRFNRDRLVKRVRQAETLKSQVAFVWNLPWRNAMSRIRGMQARGSLPAERVFYYFDPPFFEKAERLYTYYFNEQDHHHLRDFIIHLDDKWLLSYDPSPKVRELYGEAGDGAVHVELLYSTSSKSGRGAAQEIVLSNLEELPNETRLWRMSHEWDGRERPLLNGVMAGVDACCPELVLNEVGCLDLPIVPLNEPFAARS